MADVSDLRSAIRARTAELVRDASDEVLRETQATAPVVTGNLRNTHEVSGPVEQGNVTSSTLSAEAPYAAAIADGARPHEIRPRQAQALRFVMNGRVVFARLVQHPGNRAHPSWWSTQVLQERWRTALDRLTS